MYFILEAFETGATGLVSTHALVILIYTRFVAKEKLSKTELLGIAIILDAIGVIQIYKS